MKKRTKIINYIIKKCHFNSYLEIGVRNPNDNFKHINTKIKFSVDPNPKGHVTHKITSDEFFKKNKNNFDLIFIDGLHTNDQVYKDIKNSIKFLNKNGVIVIHDCNPLEKYLIRDVSKYNGGPWCGTVFRGFIRAKYNFINGCVINEETGIGIISERINIKQNEYSDKYLEWDYFNENRKEILNLITFEEFKNLMNG